MAEFGKPHEQYLQALFHDVMAQAGIGMPDCSLDEDRRLQVVYAEDAKQDLESYFLGTKGIKDYFVERYGQYRRDYDDRLPNDRFRFSKADLIWTLSVIAATNSFVRKCSPELKGALIKDINRVGMVHGIGRFALVKYNPGPQLVVLSADRVVDVTEDEKLTFLTLDGKVRPRYRYWISKPDGGTREEVKERKVAKEKSARFIPKII